MSTPLDLLSRLPTEEVETLVGVFSVHGIGALDLMELQAAARGAGDDEAKNMRFMIDLVARGTDAPPEAIGRQSLAVIRPLFGAVLRLSGLGGPDVPEEAGS